MKLNIDDVCGYKCDLCGRNTYYEDPTIMKIGPIHFEICRGCSANLIEYFMERKNEVCNSRERKSNY